jgi:hypothetical protein
MCGIVGLVSKHTNGLSHPEIDMFQNMLFVDTLRGWDSTGVFGVDTYGSVGIAKAAMHGADFICTKEFKAFRDAAVKNGTFVVGHNRSATRGTVSDENAHPFCVDDKIVLVQNGTWRGSHKHIKDVEVDTHAIAHLLAEEADVESAMKKVNAAYTLVWYNVDTEELHLLRNSERPLFIAEFQHSGFMFASEVETIMYAAAKNNNPKFKVEPYELPVHTLMSVKFTTKGAEITKNVINPYPKHFQTHQQHGGMHQNIMDVNASPAWRSLRQQELASAYGVGATDDEVADAQVTEVLDRTTNYVRRGFGCKPTDISVMIGEYLRANAPEFWFDDEAAAILAAAECTAYRTMADGTDDKKAFITLVDCIAANSHENCSTWHMLGVINHDIEYKGPQPVIHFTMTGMNQAQAVNAACGYAECEMSTTQLESFMSEEGRRWIVRCYAFKPEIVKVQ